MKYMFKVIEQTYEDSVWLMRASAEISELEGVHQAAMIMGTKNNIDLLINSGFPVDDIHAGPNDIIISIEAEESAVKTAMAKAEQILKKDTTQERNGQASSQDVARTSISEVAEMTPSANLALISVPGDYATGEIEKALHSGLHAMCFSDNVSLEDEVRLKKLADSKGLMLMGPDCGTAIINGIPLAFANMVAKGDIGIIGASGTGVQEVSVLIHNNGHGVSQAIGIGGRDLKKEVGGITMLRAFDILEKDNNTHVIVLISKPASDEVVEKILERVKTSKKAIVLNFLGKQFKNVGSHILSADTLEGAALAACEVSNKKISDAALSDSADEISCNFSQDQKYIRGLFTGGTLCYETTLLLANKVDNLYSNTPVPGAHPPENVWKSEANTLIDMGEDDFTRGRPHPMIDPSLRNKRILDEAKDMGTAIVLFDVVLGYGAHPDPATSLVSTIQEAKKIARNHGREILFVGHIAGTPLDFQNMKTQENMLKSEGVVLKYSNAAAVRFCVEKIPRTHDKKLLRSTR